MKLNSSLTLAFLVGSLGLGGCASITSMTTAKTLDQGDSKFIVGLGYSNLKLKVDSPDSSLKVPGADFMYRYGITNKDEIGIRIANFSFLIGDYKRSLLATDKFGVSLGAGIGGTSYSSSATVSGTSNSSSTTIVDFYVPLYLDFYAAENVTLFTAPKYIYRIASGDDASNSSQFALSGGVKFGQKSGVMLEAAWSKQLSGGDASFWQGMFSFFY
jgi:hypothetical protein